MNSLELSRMLRDWSGGRSHKEMARDLDVSIWTFRHWWYGRAMPPEVVPLTVHEIIKRMEAHPKPGTLIKLNKNLLK
jgi:hypothetical protein